MTTTSTEPEETASPARAPAGHVRWRRVLLYLLIGVIGVTAAEHWLGGRMTVEVAAAGAGVILLGLVIWRLPHLKRHFGIGNPNRRPSGSLNYPGQRGRGLMRPHRAGSPSPPQRRRAGAGLLSARPRRPSRAGGAGSGRRGGGMLRSRRHAGTTPRTRRGRSPGTGRGGAGSALAGRRAARRPGAGLSRSGRAGSPFPRAGSRRRAGAGAGRRTGTAQGRRGVLGRAGSRPLTRRGTARRRTPLHPRGGRRIAPPGRARPRTPLHPRGGPRTAPRAHPPGRSRPRTPFHPRGGPRTAPRQTPRGRSRPRTPFHPRGGPRTAPRTAPPGRAREGWHRLFGTPGSPGRARRGWHKIFGTPQQRANRRAAARSRRAGIRAARHRRALNLYGRRGHGWMLWRRWTRRTPRTHAVTGGMLTRRQRLSRWWRIRRSHAGSGLRGTRTRRAPRPLLGGSILGSPGLWRFRASWLGRQVARLDRRRQDRWLRRQRRHAPPPAVRRPSAPVPAIPGYGAVPSGTSQNRTRGGNMDPLAMADEIRSMGATEFNDSNHAHDVLVNLHEIVAAAQETLHNVAEQIREAPGITDNYAEVADEASGSLAGVVDQLQSGLGEGIVRG